LIKIIKTGVKLALLAVVANATWHLFVAYSAHYKFRDAVQYAAQNRGDKTDEQLHDYIMNLAADADVPVPEGGVVVTHVGLATAVTASYTRPLELVPNRAYPWTFSFRIDTYTLQAPNTVGLPK
jgi:hypothetical protein